MDDEAHVGLVDAHAEGVGCGNHPEFAFDEAALRVLLALGREAGMEIRRLDPLAVQVLGDLLAPLARRAVDDRAARALRGEIVDQEAVDVRELVRRLRRGHQEVEVLPTGAAVESRELDAEMLPEVVADVPDHIGLGRGGETHHRRRRLAAPLADETADVAVVRPEVVPPTRQAVRFVQHPRPDLALREGAAHRPVAQLLRRGQQDGRIAEPDPVQGLAALGHGEHAVDGDARPDAARLHAGDLVGHQRHER